MRNLALLLYVAVHQIISIKGVDAYAASVPDELAWGISGGEQFIWITNHFDLRNLTDSFKTGKLALKPTTLTISV
jgi:hypothetical protein